MRGLWRFQWMKFHDICDSCFFSTPTAHPCYSTIRRFPWWEDCQWGPPTRVQCCTGGPSRWVSRPEVCSMCHVVIMWRSCDKSVVVVWCSCDAHVTLMWWLYDGHVMNMQWMCNCHRVSHDYVKMSVVFFHAFKVRWSWIEKSGMETWRDSSGPW